MYILKYYFCGRLPDFTPDYNDMHYREITRETVKETMQSYRDKGENHDLSRYTKRTIYDIINTEDE